MFPTLPLLTVDGELAVDVDLRDDARRQATQVLTDSGLDHAAPRGAVGDPVAAILTAASEYAVDLIVVGSDEPGSSTAYSTARSDLHDRTLVGWSMSGRATTDLVIKVSPDLTGACPSP